MKELLGGSVFAKILSFPILHPPSVARGISLDGRRTEPLKTLSYLAQVRCR